LTHFSPPQPTKSELIDIWVKIASDRYGIDKRLIHAIILVESNGNPNAVGLHGEVGLMQLHPKSFPKGPVEIGKNIMTGVSYMRTVRDMTIDKVGCYWPIFYNTGPHADITDYEGHAYFKKLKAIYPEICEVKK
jgi:hypothetical protein